LSLVITTQQITSLLHSCTVCQIELNVAGSQSMQNRLPKTAFVAPDSSIVQDIPTYFRLPPHRSDGHLRRWPTSRDFSLNSKLSISLWPGPGKPTPLSIDTICPPRSHLFFVQRWLGHGGPHQCSSAWSLIHNVLQWVFKIDLIESSRFWKLMTHSIHQSYAKAENIWNIPCHHLLIVPL